MKIKCFYLLSVLFVNICCVAQIPIISYGSSWKYLDNGSDQGSNWTTLSFNDASWAQGAALLGYGRGDEATVVSYGPSGTNKFITTYFRKTFTINDISLFSGYSLNVRRDDGAVVYINGVEVFRSNMPAISISYTTLASGNAADNGNTPQFKSLNISQLQQGTNVITVEIHQYDKASSDIAFDLELTGTPANVIIPFQTSWKYLDNGSNQGTNWKSSSFNDGTWATGNGKFGYGISDAATLINYGSDANNKYITTYFRKVVNIPDISGFTSYTMYVKRDDGVAVYVNGTEVVHDNISTSAFDYLRLANSAPDNGYIAQTFVINASAFVNGTNIIAAEVHQASVSSTDLAFDLQLSGNTTPLQPTLTTGPYMNIATETGIVIRWKTDIETDSKVSFGTSAASLTQSAVDNTLTTDHIVQLAGLTGNTKYYYSIGTTTGTLQGDADNYFKTAPPIGSTQKIRILAMGDMGSNSTNQFNVRNAYLNYNANNLTDIWMLLGDNAYDNGLATEYQNNFFNIYQGNLTKNHVLWPAPGNHDYANNAARQADHAIPYYDVFTLPTNGEAGGVASGTEAYYSYNYGNIHFLSLDSYGWETGNTRLYDTTGPQVTWLKQDLAANNQKWTIVYFHHPPYSKGSHNSDTETELVKLRENLVRILERYKVDLVLGGHSHSYERSFLINGHYGMETSFNPALHALSTSSAHYDGTTNSCPYTKDSTEVRNGVVYAVVGVSGQVGGSTPGYPHDAMQYSNVINGGSMVIEVEDNRLDAKFVCSDGVIRDNFTIMKDVVNTIDTTITAGNAVTLTASWVGNYLWSTGATTRSITVSPTSNVSITVQDNVSCLNDVFNISVSTGPTLVASSSAGTILCKGENTTVTITATGGTSPYTGTGNFTAGVGVHQYTVTDAIGNTATTTVVIDEPDAITVDPSTTTHTDASCDGTASGSITLGTTSGGTEPYAYTWTKSGDPLFSANTANLSSLLAGMYNYSVTDKNGCTPATGSVDIALNTNIIDASAGSNGSISPGGSVSAACGDTKTFAITPAACYHILNVLVDGVSNIDAINNGSYTFDNITGNHTISATFAINAANAGTITGSSNVCVGATTTYTSNGAPAGTWSSSNTNIATINGSGVITGISAGSAIITYTVVDLCGSASTTKTITVNSAGTISGPSTLCVGSSGTLKSNVGGGKWSSSNTGVATINANNGKVSGIAAGNATIIYTLNTGCTATYPIAVLGSTANAGTITGISTLCINETTTYTSNGTPGGNWSSSNPAVATVSAQGIVTGISSGTSSIIYTVAGCSSTVSSSKTVTVSSSVSAGTVTGVTPLCIGATTTYTSSAAGGTWSSDNTSIATVNSTSGLVTGIAEGSAGILYTVSSSCGTASASKTVAVTTCAGPSITCPASISDNLVAGCTKTIAVLNPTISNTTILTWVMTGATTGVSPSTGINYVGTRTFNKGVTTVIYTASNDAGVSTTCQFNVTLADNITPTISCPGNISQTANGKNCTKSISVPNPTFADNCGVTTLSWVMSGATTGSSLNTGINYVSSKTFNVGVTTIIYTAGDAANNKAVCSLTVTLTNSKCSGSQFTSLPRESWNLISDEPTGDELTIKVNPNPTSHKFRLTIQSGSSEKIEVVVTDILGRKVFQMRDSINQTYQFGNDFKAGIYIIQVIQGKRIRTLKLIKA